MLFLQGAHDGMVRLEGLQITSHACMQGRVYW